MLDLPSKEERLRQNRHSSHKADYYRDSGCRLFIESEVGQATNITRMTGRPVYCVDAHQMMTPEWASMSAQKKGQVLVCTFKRMARRVVTWLPAPLARQARSVYQRLA